MQKIRVLYDSDTFDLQKFGGISRYFSELISIFKRSASIEPLFKLIISNNEYAKYFKLTLINSSLNDIKIKGFRRLSWKLNHYVNSIYTKYHLFKGDFDIFHPTYYNEKYIKHRWWSIPPIRHSRQDDF